MTERTLVHYLPIITTVVAAIFAASIYRRYVLRGREGTHLLWWSGGVVVYGLGTFSEAWMTLFGVSVGMFKFWYIVGALLGGAPLATGTVWLLLRPNLARYFTGALVGVVLVAAVFVLASPVDLTAIPSHLPSGRAFERQWVRAFSPFINTYAVVFLIGGAGLSAWRFAGKVRRGGEGSALARDRFVGNVLIAVGAILPGIGGASSRAGHTEVLYVTELAGILLIWLGYWFNIRRRPVQPSAPDHE